jgi:hypothetical protein
LNDLIAAAVFFFASRSTPKGSHEKRLHNIKRSSPVSKHFLSENAHDLPYKFILPLNFDARKTRWDGESQDGKQ